ncbi:hypothetical protein GCM10023065_30930 [Microbacterium laevaniformans]
MPCTACCQNRGQSNALALAAAPSGLSESLKIAETSECSVTLTSRESAPSRYWPWARVAASTFTV